ncbi:Ornithine decarboxylase [Bachmanniomyces sp. S44760]|nr:Ornithine decarboxylase [Bachmanniomyces sp. S44760]
MAPSATTFTEQQYAPITLSRDKLVTEFDAYDAQYNRRELTGQALQERIRKINTDICDVGEEDAFFVADMGEVYRQHRRWKTNLPRVKPHYGILATSFDEMKARSQVLAVKCNPDLEVLRLLAALGTGFDCASKAEIEQVLKVGVDPSRIIYAQPCKTKSYIRYAAQNHVKQMTFDNADELYKTKAIFPDAELFLRILTDDSSSLCRLSQKFGASLDNTQELLKLAKELGLNVIGVSFHVGSGASDPQSFVKAIQDSRIVFDQAQVIGLSMSTLDVGGGFTGDTFEVMAGVLSEALDDYFPRDIRVIGEPGRYYVASAFTLACNVIARRDLQNPATGSIAYMLYINDGVYGNFSSIIFDHQIPVAQVVQAKQSKAYSKATEYSIWGPTCDGIDRITESCTFDHVVDVGDWLYFEEMGAYTKCSATRFNGFTDNHEVLYVCSEPGASAVLGYSSF